MKNWIRYALLAVWALASLTAVADEATEPLDTVYFYDTWEQMLDQTPVAAVVSPYIEAYTPYEIYIHIGNDQIDDVVSMEHLAATLGDSIWLVSSQFLKTEFKGDVRKLHGFVPVFFNEKVAFITFADPSDELSFKTFLFGQSEDEIEFENLVNYYYIDFSSMKVLKVTPDVLSELLEDYHDLKMRYEGMKDYKKRHIIREFFLKYVDRATQDVMRPYILDLVD